METNPPTPRTYKRKRKLIRPALQFRITLAFMSTSILVLALMGSLVSWFLSGDAIQVPTGSEYVVAEIKSVLAVAFGLTMILLVPLTLFVGLQVTHMVAGPIYRFEQFLGSVINGEKPGDCKLRKGDELMDICDLINEATRPVREQVQAEGPRALEPPSESKAA
ncbi:MAG: hypothetical protein ACI8X5_003191 [Planctomycetota bacterium]|jgi:hypothetical protein